MMANYILVVEITGFTKSERNRVFATLGCKDIGNRKSELMTIEKDSILFLLVFLSVSISSENSPFMHILQRLEEWT